MAIGDPTSYYGLREPISTAFVLLELRSTAELCSGYVPSEVSSP